MRLVIVLLLAGLAWPAVAQTIAPDLPSLIAAAKHEGTLDVVWSVTGMGDSQAAAQHQAAFRKLFGTQIALHFTPGPEYARQGNQLYTEWQAGQPNSSDIYIASAAQFAPLVARGLFTPVDWPKLEPQRIAPAYSEAGGRALRLFTAVSVVDYNTQLVPHPPTTLWDMTKPEWQGKLATTPYAAGYDILAANDLWGPDKAIAFVRALSKNVAGLIRCGEMERLASGEFSALVMDCTNQGAALWKARGAPVDSFIPSDAAQKRYDYFAVPRNARHPNAAVLFGLYLLSAPGQAVLWDTVRDDLDSLPGSHMAQVFAPYETKGLKFTDVTVDWTARHPEIDTARAEMAKILSTAR